MQDIVVIGAPNGGGAALVHILRSLPRDMAASFFAVLHYSSDSPILLADLLNAPGRMRAAEALDGEQIARRRIYVAADSKDLLISDGKVRLKTNRHRKHRPAIDALFASAAEVYRSRVIGVLLLHARDDGSAGLKAIRQAGGRTLTHLNPLMPEPPVHPGTGESLSDEHLPVEEIANRLMF